MNTPEELLQAARKVAEPDQLKLEEAFLKAVDKGDLDGLEAAAGRLSLKTVSNIRDSRGRSALHLAACAGNLDVIKHLVTNLGFNLDAQDAEGGRECQ
jgi:hypothetical protein